MCTLLATVEELAGVHALGSDEQLRALLVAVRVSEHNASQRRSAARVVDDVLQWATQQRNIYLDAFLQWNVVQQCMLVKIKLFQDLNISRF